MMVAFMAKLSRTVLSLVAALTLAPMLHRLPQSGCLTEEISELYIKLPQGGRLWVLTPPGLSFDALLTIWPDGMVEPTPTSS